MSQDFIFSCCTLVLLALKHEVLCHKRNKLPLNFSWFQCHWPDVQLHYQIPPTLNPKPNLHHRPMMHVCCNFQPLTSQSSALITINPLCIHAVRIKPWSNGCHLSLQTTPPNTNSNLITGLCIILLSQSRTFSS